MAKQPSTKAKKTTGEKVKAQKISTYLWSGNNRNGGKVSGEIQGQNIALVKAELKKQGITHLKVKKGGVDFR